MKAINILNEFITSNDSNPSVQDEGLLLQAYELIKDDLIETSYSIKTVRLAHKIFGYLGDRGLQERIDTMRKYLDSNQKKSLEDQFWARWELVDNLALLKKISNYDRRTESISRMGPRKYAFRSLIRSHVR